VDISDDTEGLAEAGVMSYTTPDNTAETKVIKELPKPSQHESEVLVENKVALKQDDNGGFVPRRKISAKGKEKWIKDWVSRKYNKPKFPRGPLLPFAPSHHRNQPETTSQVVTTKEEPEVVVEKENRNEVVLDDAANESLLALFAPTMPSKTGVDVKEEDRRPLVDKYSSSSRQSVISSLFNKQETAPVPVSAPAPVVTRTGGVPRGARTEVFKSWGGTSLSQAEFERQILGVSTATEISVKSMICVKGRCFNADESGKFLQN